MDNCAYGHYLAYNYLKKKSNDIPHNDGAERIYYIKDEFKYGDASLLQTTHKCRTKYLDMVYLFALRKFPNVKRIYIPYFLIVFIGILATLFYWTFYYLG
jgi:hypothetical protein